MQDVITTNIILYCRKWAETVRFYEQGLGLPVSHVTDWFVEFSLTDSSRLSIADEGRASIKSGGGAGVTLAVQVEDVDAAWERAESSGLGPTGVQEHPWRARVFHVFDPEGHRVEFWESGPPAVPS